MRCCEWPKTIQKPGHFWRDLHVEWKTFLNGIRNSRVGVTVLHMAWVWVKYFQAPDPIGKEPKICAHIHFQKKKENFIQSTQNQFMLDWPFWSSYPDALMNILNQKNAVGCSVC